MAGRARRTTFFILTRGRGEKWREGYGRGYEREPREGYVSGEFAVHKEPGRGHYFWTLTHLPTGMSVNTYPPLDGKTQAIAALSLFAENLNGWDGDIFGDERYHATQKLYKASRPCPQYREYFPRGADVVKCSSCGALFGVTAAERAAGRAVIPEHAPGQRSDR